MIDPSTNTWWEKFFDEFELFMSKLLPVLAILVGFVIKLGDDLVNKRTLTWGQRAGVYMITIGFGFLGWWICIGLEYTSKNWRMPLIITTFGYSGEYFLKWLVANKTKILNWLLLRNFNKKSDG